MKKYSGSTSDDIFHDEFDTIQEAQDYFNDDLQERDIYYIGENVKLTVKQFVDVEFMIERMVESAVEEVGDVGEDYLRDVTEEEKDELTEIIAKWFKNKGYSPSFVKVENIETYISTGEKAIKPNK